MDWLVEAFTSSHFVQNLIFKARENTLFRSDFCFWISILWQYHFRLPYCLTVLDTNACFKMGHCMDGAIGAVPASEYSEPINIEGYHPSKKGCLPHRHPFFSCNIRNKIVYLPLQILNRNEQHKILILWNLFHAE